MKGLLHNQTGPDGETYGFHCVAEILTDSTAEAYAVVESRTSLADYAAPAKWRRTYRFTRATSDPLADAYTFLATLPEFVGAQEVS